MHLTRSPEHLAQGQGTVVYREEGAVRPATPVFLAVPTVDTYGPQEDTIAGSSSSARLNVSRANSLAAFSRRFSCMRTILLRTILRQYEPSSLGCTTVTCLVFMSYMTTACSRITPALTAHSAPSMPTAPSAGMRQFSILPESITAMRLPTSSSAPTMRPRGARVLESYSTSMPYPP